MIEEQKDNSGSVSLPFGKQTVVGSTVILGDCVQLMKEYEDGYFDLAVVDPPYEGNDAIDLKNNNNFRKQATKRKVYHLFENTMPNDEYFEQLFRVSKHQIIWGGNYFGISGGVIVWQKNGTAFGEGEVAICSTHKSVRFFEFTWNGMIQGDMKNKEQRIHPTQKPVALYDYCFSRYATSGMKILDTHLGSGSSRIAADKAGLDFTGFELLAEHYNNQEKRFKQYKSQLRIEGW